MSVPDFLVLREGKLNHTSLKVPPTQQAVIGGPSFLHRSAVMPFSDGVMTSKTTRTAPMQIKLSITPGSIRSLLHLSIIIVLKLLRREYSLSISHFVPGARLLAKRAASRVPSLRADATLHLYLSGIQVRSTGFRRRFRRSARL